MVEGFLLGMLDAEGLILGIVEGFLLGMIEGIMEGIIVIVGIEEGG